MATNSPEQVTSSPSGPISTSAPDQPKVGQAMSEEHQVLHHIVVLTAFGVIAIVAALFTTIIDWTVLAWRTAWLGVCIAAFIGSIALNAYQQ
jgi:hypothetical protein